jgi:hypothetical protein
MTDDFKRLKRRLRTLSLAAETVTGAGRLMVFTARFLLALVIYGAADIILAIPDPLRAALWVCFAIVGFLGVIWSVRGLLVLRLGETAKTVDSLTPGGEEKVLSAWELNSRGARGRGALEAFLIGRLTAEAGLALDSFKTSRILPLKQLRGNFYSLLKVLALAAVLAAVNFQAFVTAAGRTLNPLADIPPWSLTKITVRDSDFKVVYGGSVELSAEVGGKSGGDTVSLLAKNAGGAPLRIPCFNDGNRVFSARLENVTEPVSFCFSSGKARSRWMSLDLLMRPVISAAKLTVRPPAYSLQGERSFPAGSRPLKSLKGSAVALDIISNRPPGQGSLEIISDSGESGKISRAEGSVTGKNTVRFEWELKESARLRIIIKDNSGRASDPLLLEQRVEPDNPPSVSIDEPAPFIIALEDAVVPVTVSASDDFGLKRVEFLRCVKGCRDRAKLMGPEKPETRFSAKTEFDLKKLGAAPGDVIEYYFEASDCNPGAVAAGSSAVQRILVTSKEEHRKALLGRMETEAVFKKFSAAEKALSELRKALSDLRDAAAAPDSAPDKLTAALEAARDKNLAAAATLAAIKADFPVFDIEVQTMDLFEKLHAAAAKNHALLSEPGLAENRDALRKAAESALGGMAEYEEREAALNEDMRYLRRLSEIMRLAKEFSDIAESQERLVKSLNRARAPSDNFFSALRDEEKALFDRLSELADRLSGKADSLPDSESELKDGIRSFSSKIAELRITDDLKDCASLLLEKKLFPASAAASKALSKMRSLMSDDGGNSMGGMCQRKLSFSICRKGASRSASEMLDSIFGRGKGFGFGAGGGGDGSSDDGYSADAATPMNVPVYGADRQKFSDAGSGSGLGGNKSGPGCPGACPVTPASSERLTGQEKKQTASRGAEKWAVPEKYGKAVKKYFGGAQE